MAEGFANYYWKDQYNCYSAGVEAHGVNALAVKVMAELEIDISNQKSKIVGSLKDIGFDCVITVCDDAYERCPLYLKNTKLIHKAFQDPARAKGSEEDIISTFRQVRDKIKSFIKNELNDIIKN